MNWTLAKIAELTLPAFLQDGLDRHGEQRDQHDLIESFRLQTSSRCLLLDGEGRVAVQMHETALYAESATQFATAGLSFLGRDEACAWFAQEWPSDALHESAMWLDLRSVAAQLPAPHAGMAAYARALLHWQRQHRFCGACGATTALHSAGHKAVCTACRQEFFPRTDPVVIGLVEHQGRCLLARQASWPAGRYAAIAGFVEPGESLEAAFAREVLEESGLSIEHPRYIASQPWPFPTSIMIGFLANAIDDQFKLGIELEDARWFTPRELQASLDDNEISMPSTYSLSRHLIDMWFATHTHQVLRVKS